MLLDAFSTTLKKEGFRNAALRSLKVLSIRIPRFVKSLPFVFYGTYRKKTQRRVNGQLMSLYFNDHGISRELFIYKKREHFSTDLMLSGSVVRPGDIVLDIGANIGYYALIESTIAGDTGKVYAVEPVPRNFDILQENVTANRASNVELHNLALGDHTGTAQMFVSDHSNWSRLAVTAVPDKMIETTEVTVSTADEFLRNKTPPDVIRMDVEGYELRILRGMKETLGSSAPRIFVELHPNLMERKDIDEIFDILESYGYEVEHCLLNPNLEQNPVTRFAYKRLGEQDDFEGCFMEMDLSQARAWARTHDFKRLPHFLFSKPPSI
jgi:FkbM family methyltransferase